MPKDKMKRVYFEEKKKLALEGIKQAQDTANNVVELLSSWNYDLPDIPNADEVHDCVCVAKAQLDSVRRNFEKVRWSSTNTELDFDEWLVENGHADLVM